MDSIFDKWKMNKSFKTSIKKFGKVVTRMPPEPSGYFHIGHAKALFINFVVARFGKGRMLLRFDDTNPSRESEEYSRVMLEDMHELLKAAGEDPANYQPTYTSDYFDQILDCADYLVKTNQAYVDGSSGDMINFMRLNRMRSPYSTLPQENTLMLWERMKRGELKGVVLRLKIDYESKNGCLRDPTIYRTVDGDGVHLRTGDRFKIYPTYDFACPIVDCLEGVTHVFRSTEFTDRNPQYKRIAEMLGLVCPALNQYGKLVFKDTVLSKRKIRALIDNNEIDGWDDPRLLTWRGAKKRGLSAEGLIQFLSKVGISKSCVEMDPTSLWSVNQKVIDKISTRFVAIPFKEIVEVEIVGELPYTSKEIDRFNRNKGLGTRTVHYDKKLYMWYSEFQDVKENEEVTLINWGNAIYLGDNKFKLHLEGDFKKTEKKLLWVPLTFCLYREIHDYDRSGKLQSTNMITESMIIDCESQVPKYPYFQFLRFGYYHNNGRNIIKVPK